MRKLKKPNGYILEEFTTASAHVFEDGKFIYHDNDPDYGDYTGRFCFCFTGKSGENEKYTKWYTRSNAPKWLIAMLNEAME